MVTGILSAVSAIIGVPMLVNGLTLIYNNATNIGTYLTVFLGLAFILIAVFMKLIKKFLIYPLFRFFWTIMCLCCVLAVIFSSFLYVYGKTDTVTYNEDYLVVLGCGLNGTEPSEVLISRLDEAIDYANRNTDCTIIVTGGMGKNEDIPEAVAMAKYLIDNGINPDRIIQECESTSTSENFKFSNRLTDGNLQTSSAVFITNDFHIFRANSISRLQGISMNHLSAKTPLHSVIPSYLRENLALVQMLIFNK